MSKLLLVRHGLTDFNSNRRFGGYSDIEMSPVGCRQAESLRDRLAEQRIDAVYSSDLKRALNTAEIISAGREIEVITCPELREMNYGYAEGLTFDQISELYPDVAELCLNFSLLLKFPGGEGFEEFIERTIKFVDRLKEHALEETVLVVSHNGPLRVLVCHFLGIDQQHWEQIRISNASLSIVETYPQRVVLSLMNDTSHLTGVRL